MTSHHPGGLGMKFCSALSVISRYVDCRSSARTNFVDKNLFRHDELAIFAGVARLVLRRDEVRCV
ncbi:hypothetical protein ACWGNF_32110 [Streptomyces sp. NPDC055808]|uniref:hypothetical protein n=1 Tax=Streptomyces sp. NPDC001828 TaxID=3364615 RepID=UPI0036D1A512